MSQLINNRDLAFQLYEMFDLNELLKRPRFEEHSKETFDAVLDTAEKIALKYFLPHNHTADQKQPKFIDGKVKMIPEVKEAFDAQREAGFIAAGVDFEEGGMQLPLIINLAASSFFTSANCATTAYSFLTAGAANLIRVFGNDEQKEKYVSRMITGEFTGTMALTEPGAGSSLSDITTQAIPKDDGTYKIKGQKIFISAGDHELSENIVHMVLARVKGAPAGVKGISLFIVPKFKLNENDQPGERNDVNLAGLFHKMGYRGTTSTSLSFGEKNNCTGYLVGEVNNGLKYMFQMMNEARLWVGFCGVILGYRGYLESLAYARERPQGRKPTEKDPSSPQVNIVEHADVKRMLLAQKSFVEGGLSLCLYSASLVDDSETLEGPVQQKAAAMLDLLMPIVKSTNSEYGLKANELAIQVLGGAGYTNEYPVEQCYRDNRLNPIHEGTTGIQALDLLGRKAWTNNGETMQQLFADIAKDIAIAKEQPQSSNLAKSLELHLTTAAKVTQQLAGMMQQVGPEKTLANANCYLSLLGKLVFGWMWIRQATVAEKAIEREQSNAEELSFYQGKMQAAKYFIGWELPKLQNDAEILIRLDDTCLEMQNDWF
ncbi:MAG: acyl-CoA dehydrogenase [Kangiellaceae bacterium]|nr:acyl-CoA dehydrogenase [Kangiellaceae bacterium]